MESEEYQLHGDYFWDTVSYTHTGYRHSALNTYTVAFKVSGISVSYFLEQLLIITLKMLSDVTEIVTGFGWRPEASISTLCSLIC